MTIELGGARVLVTGASSGIGWACAEALARAGAVLALSARRVERLEELRSTLEGSGHVIVECDLALAGAAQRMAEQTWDQLGHLDVIVHNAAMPKRRDVTALTPDEVATTMRVNFEAPVAATLATLPKMLERGRGMHVYVSSLGGRLGIIHEAAYCASKFALCGWAEAMAIDLATSPVDVRLILPGPIDTEIWDHPSSDAPIYEGPKEPPSVVAAAIAQSITDEGFERYAPDMRGILTWRNSDPDAFIAAAGSMGTNVGVAT